MTIHTASPLTLQNPLQRKWITPLFTCLLVGSGLLGTGCEKKEKIIDIETPRTKVEVKRDQDTGKVEVEVNRTEPTKPTK